MVRKTFSGREIAKVLRSFGYVPVSREGSHVRLRYKHPDTGNVRNVDVPQHDEVAIGTLHSIADQCGADDFQAWCDSDYCESLPPGLSGLVLNVPEAAFFGTLAENNRSNHYEWIDNHA